MQLKLVTVFALLPAFVQAITTPTVSGTKIALTKRSSLVENGVANMTALQNHIAHVQRKIARGFSNYETNTGEVHPNYRTARASDKRHTGEVYLTNVGNTLWQGDVIVGTPQKTFTVDFDTGSSDLILPSVHCDQTCEGHTLYDPSESTTVQILPVPFSHDIGDGLSVNGTQCIDAVRLGALKTEAQRIGVASSYPFSPSTAQFAPDGVLGLGLQSISSLDSPPVFQSFVEDGVATSPEFGFTFRPSGSELYLGGVDKSKFSGDLTYTNVTTPGYWQIRLDGASVGSLQVIPPVDAIVDTGSALIIGDSSNVKTFYAEITGAVEASPGIYTYPCNSTLDSIALIIGGKNFTISQENFNVGFDEEAAKEGAKVCIGGVVADNSLNSPFWILGDVFLKNVYTSFDVEKLRVGFAQTN